MFKVDNKLDFITDVLVTALITSFTILSGVSNGIFIMMGLLVLIMTMNIVRHGFHIRKGIYLVYMLAVTLYTYATSLWALEPSDTYAMVGSLVNITLCMVILYDTYYNVNLYRLLRAIMWSGYVLVIYTISYYGLSYVLQVLAFGERMASDFANINNVAMAATFSIIINCYFVFYNKWDFSILFSLPALLVLFGSGTRKAVVMIIAGIFILVIMKQVLKGKNIFSLFFRVFIIIFVMILVVLIIAQLDMAQGIVERMNGLIASFTGQGVADHSALIRSDLRSLGFSTMLKHPMGIGIGCPHILALQYLSEDYYLHCNYAEIAAGGGFLGLIVFYSIYLHFAKLCYYLKKDSLAIILSALVIVMLLKDYGAVSYYYKDNYMIFVLICLYLSQKKRGALYGFDKQL